MKIKTIYSRFLVYSLLFLGAIFFTSSFLGQIVQKVSFIKSFDNYFYSMIASGYHSYFLDILVWPVNSNFLPSFFGANPSFLFIFFLIFLLSLIIWKRKDLVWALFTYLIALALTFGSLWSSIHFVDRSRPFLSLPNLVSPEWQNIWIHFTSWPSGHVRDAVIISMLFSYFFPKTRWYLFALLIYISWSRIYVGAHYPTDVIGAILIGLLIGGYSIYCVEFIRAKRDEKKK